MVAEIAAMVDANGYSGILNEPGEVVVYRRDRRGWDVTRRMAVSLDQCMNLHEMRLKMADILAFMDGCTTFVAKAAGGALSFELEKGGCSVWETTGLPSEFLDSVLEDEEKERIAASTAAAPEIPRPCETAPGRYFISIKDIQGKNPELTSKHILQQFVTEGDFSVLEILCDHVPPWIEIEAEQKGYGIEAEKYSQDEVLVRLTGTTTC